MSWFKNLFNSNGDRPGMSGPEAVIVFYQQLGFFAGAAPATVVRRYTTDHREPPDSQKPWDDVFLLSYADGEVWASDPEADVCAENEIYSEVLPQWASVSCGTFAPSDITEHWESENGPIVLSFQLGGQPASVTPSYQDDWIDLEVLLQINRLITPSGRQFECAVDGNFVLVLCLTSEQKSRMQIERKFPFAW